MNHWCEKTGDLDRETCFLKLMFLEGDPKDWKRILETNVYGLAVCSHFAIKQMREAGINGHIVNISSVVGHQVIKMPLPTFNMYAPSKFAVTALEKVLDHELAHFGSKIKVSVRKTAFIFTHNFDPKIHVLECQSSISVSNRISSVWKFPHTKRSPRNIAKY